MSGLTANLVAPYDRTTGHPSMVVLGGSMNIVGTQATTAAAVTGSYVRIPFNCKLVAASFAQEVGATAAGPTVHIDRSVGGTGSYAAIATHAFGTVKSTAGEDVTIPAGGVALADGDHLRLELQVGTTASSERDVGFSFALVSQPN